MLSNYLLGWMGEIFFLKGIHMKNLAKVMFGVAAVAAVTASAAGQFPFPQNMKYPHGKIIEYADTDMIKEHYKLWKQAWYQASNGWVLAPEGTCSTVSEAIAYGMLISVYMDDQDVFKKLYNTWTSNSAGANGGMNWRIGCRGGTGTASDADFDAALALVMASKQWNDASYLSAGKSLISWIASNDIASNKIKPGNQWNDGFNPSYATLGHFRLFEAVTGDSQWSTRRQKAAKDLLACQDSKTGLVPDWCDWNSHKPILTSAAVSNDIGFYDDAARTPWRTAWAYYWYADADAKTFNQKVADWLIPETRTASGVNSGYKYSGGAYIIDNSDIRRFVSSTFSGGLGLATSSVDGSQAETYLGTVYKVLKEKKSCATAQGCGEGSVEGEKYYPATLNMLYLLLVTGNMPNLYDLTGFEKFTPDPSKAPSISAGDGEHLEFGDTTVAVSGLWNWGAYHDKLGIGTKMVPDSGASPLYRLDDGSIVARASMEIGPEPEWTEAAAKAGTLKYPSAGIAVSFKKDDCKNDGSCGVDFKALGIQYIRVTAKTSGPIRMAILNTITDENEKKKVENAGAGSEPGIYVDNTEDYTAVTYDMTPYEYGFKGLGNGKEINILDWVNKNNAPEGGEILSCIKGIKWEVKDAKGGIGEISIKAVEFLDASKQPIDPVKLTGVEIKEVGLYKVTMMPHFSVRANGMQLNINGAKVGSNYAVYNMQGKAVAAGITFSSNIAVNVPNAGSYIVRVGSEMSRVNVK